MCRMQDVLPQSVNHLVKVAKNGRNAIQQCAVQALGQTFFKNAFEFLHFCNFMRFLQNSMQFTGKKYLELNVAKEFKSDFKRDLHLLWIPSPWHTLLILNQFHTFSLKLQFTHFTFFLLLAPQKCFLFCFPYPFTIYAYPGNSFLLGTEE